MVNIRPGVMFLPVFHKDLFLALLFLIYINDFSDGLKCNSKLFADDILLVATVHNIDEATNDLNNEFIKITKWAFQWKMSFNPDISIRAY